MARLALFITAVLTTCLLRCASALNKRIKINVSSFNTPPSRRDFVGGVYVMSNHLQQNSIIAYARRANGTLSLLQPALRTGGQGAILSFDSGADPLFSAFSVIITSNYKFVLAVNAGSNSVSVFRILRDFSLRLVHVQAVRGVGPNSIAVSGNLVYVASADADGNFTTPISKQGVLSGFVLTSSGRLIALPRSGRVLTFRPSAIKFSPDRRSLVVSSLFTSVTAAATGTLEEIVVFSVNRLGLLSSAPVSAATSTEFGNAERRNLPGVIGFDIVKSNGVQYVVVPEVRSIVGSDGMDALEQAASVSTWRLDANSALFAVQLDVPVGSSVSSGQQDSCWLEFTPDLKHFFVSNTASNSTSVFSFDQGVSTLQEEVGASGGSPIDVWSSRDSKFVYQLFSGAVGVFQVGERGTLNEMQRAMNVPERNAQGIVAF
eukprot:TRINITY_DN1980_c0_g1_i1.p1 TRINITY_DN1980_c0_g1~~TRINITY_DN1980_c0_g1_i1.p1  ORF type:complete len:460 (+),score=87.53 TRINITY_DN1980_c0_g1_i1:87-1382(+)